MVCGKIFTSRHALVLKDGAFRHTIDYVSIFEETLNLEGHLNRFIGSKVTAILVNRGILPNGGVAEGRVCACSLRSRLVFTVCAQFFVVVVAIQKKIILNKKNLIKLLMYIIEGFYCISP